MADNQQNDAYKLSLDAQEFIATLQKALGAYTFFRKEFGRSLKVRIDDTQLRNLAKYIGQEFKSVAESITKTVKPALASVSQQAATTAKSASKNMQQVGKAGQKAAQDIAEAWKALPVEVDGKTKIMAANTVRSANAAIEKIIRLQQKIKDQSKLVDQTGASTVQSRSNALDFVTFDRTRGEKGNFRLDQVALNRLAEQARAIRAKELEDDRRIVAVEKAHYQAAQLTSKELEKQNRDSLKVLEATDRMAAAAQRYRLAAEEAAKAINHIRTMKGLSGRVSAEDFLIHDDAQNAVGVNRGKIADTRRADAQTLKSIRDQQLGINGLTKTQKGYVDELGRGHQNILTSLTQQGLRLAKFMVIYRVMSDSINLIRSSMSSLVQAGFEYTRQLEIQRLGLQGILAENFNIADAQGNQLHGAAAINQLQGEALKQWRQLQSASLAVVGSTEDLMLLYNSILPYAAKLGKTTEDVQKMVKATAVAASLMDISFQDARSALVSLLQGRNLQRNRLVSVLGISDAEIKNLKGTPELFDRIFKSLDSFSAIADQAQNSFGALLETFKELTGMIGSQFVQPFVDQFKQLMTGVSGKGGILGMLFSDTTGTMKPKAETQAFFTFIRTQIEATLGPVRKFGDELQEAGSKGLMSWTIGAASGVKALVQLAVEFGRATIALANFITNNRSLIVLLGKLAIFVIATTYLKNFGAAVLSTATKLGVLSTATKTASMSVAQYTSTTKTAATELSVLQRAQAGLTAAVTQLATGIMTGGILIALGYLIQKYSEMRQKAEDAANAQKLLQRGDLFGSLANTQTGMNSDDPNEQLSALRVFGAGVDRIFGSNGADSAYAEIAKQSNLLKDLAANGSNAADVYRGLNAAQAEVNKQLQSGNKLTKEELDAAKQKLVDIRDAKNKLQDLTSSLQQWATVGQNRLTGQILQERNLLKQLEKERDDKVESNVGARSPAEMRWAASEAEIDDVKAKIAATNDRIQALIAERAKAADALKKANGDLSEIEGADTVTMTPAHKAEPVDPFAKHRSPFRSEAADNLKSLEVNLDKEAAVYKAKHDERLMEDEEFDQKMDDLERRRLDAIKTFNQIEVQEFTKYQRDLVARKLTPVKEAAEEIENFQRDADNRLREADAQLFALDQKRKAHADAKPKRIADLKQEADDRIDRALGGVFGDSEEKVSAALDKIATDIKQKFARQNEAALGESIAKRILEAIPDASSFKAAETAFASLKQQLSNLRQEQQGLDQDFQNGSVSLDDYREATERNRQAQLGNLDAQREAVETLVALGEAHGMSAEQLDRLRGELTGINRDFKQTAKAVQDLTHVMGTFQDLLANIQDLGSMFDGIGKGLSNVLGIISAIPAKAGSITNLTKTFGSFMNQFKNLQKVTDSAGNVSKAGGLKTFFSMFGGAAGDGAKGATNAMAALGAVTFGASAAIGIGVALYERAVKKAEETIKKSFEDISKRLSAGTVTIGQAVQDMERERQRLVQKYSGSKSGRKALKEMLPDVDNEIDQLKQKITDIRKNFEDALKNLQMGDGPFGDFARQLLELEKFTQEYLDTFVQNTPEFFEAQSKVFEYYQLFLKQAKQALLENFANFESTAVSAAQRVISLMDQQADLQGQLISLNEQRADIHKQINDLAEEEVEHAKEEADARQKIADIMRDAAEAEAEIRRRGVLEAQLSVAEKKANEIARLRDKTLQELQDAQDDLEKIHNDTSIQDKRNDLDKRLRDADAQEDRIRRQQRLTQIELDGAVRVAQIEGAMFGIQGDRYELARRAADLEVRQAQIQVGKWRETKALIDAIVSGANGYSFDPPAGFPQIKVQIGDIVINNQDQSNNVVTTPGDGRPGPGRRRPPDAPDRGKAIPRRSASASFGSDFERQFPGDTAIRR